MFAQFYFDGGGIGNDYYFYPFEKELYKEELKLFEEINDKFKVIFNLDVKITTKKDLDKHFDKIYNKYIYPVDLYELIDN